MLFSDSTYDPETVALMGRAYDAAAKAALNRGIAVVSSEPVQSAMAMRIMAAVGRGERDLEQLTLCALSAVDGTISPPPTQTT